MTELRTHLNCSPAEARRWTWLKLGMIAALLLQGAPAAAQENPPDPDAQPTSSSEQSAAKEGASDKASLEELLQEETPTATVGSFGYRLRRYGITPYFHGALAVDLWRWRQEEEGDPYYQGFDLRDAHLYFGADIANLIIPEMFLELESNEPGASELFLRYAQFDVRLKEELLVMRAGLFLLPFGSYNTVAFPRFITKLPDRPTYFDEITPVAWREVGVQLGGKWTWRPGLSLSYAVYVTNGMEQPDNDDPDDPTDDGVDEGGPLGELQNAFEEARNSSKSIGARLRLEPLPGLGLGLSGYTGAYTVDGKRRLSAAGLDVSFHRGGLSLEMETALVHQEITGGALTKWGYAVIGAYRVHPMFEPVLAIDEVRLDGDPGSDARTLWAGLNVFPFPDQIPTAQLKAAYSYSFHGIDHSHGQATLQFVIGF